jgi:hypothetical protein
MQQRIEKLEQSEIDDLDKGPSEEAKKVSSMLQDVILTTINHIHKRRENHGSYARTSLWLRKRTRRTI